MASTSHARAEKKTAVITSAQSAESRIIQQTERSMLSLLPEPKWRLTVSAKPLFKPKASVVMRLYNAAVEPICESAASPSICPAMAVSTR